MGKKKPAKQRTRKPSAATGRRPRSPTSDADVYGSGLDSSDWGALFRVVSPFIHVEDPAAVALPEDLPEHLSQHQIVLHIRRYQQTGESKFLDQAGRLLFPCDTPFGWYVALTK